MRFPSPWGRNMDMDGHDPIELEFRSVSSISGRPPVLVGLPKHHPSIDTSALAPGPTWHALVLADGGVFCDVGVVWVWVWSWRL